MGNFNSKNLKLLPDSKRWFLPHHSRPRVIHILKYTWYMIPSCTHLYKRVLPHLVSSSQVLQPQQANPNSPQTASTLKFWVWWRPIPGPLDDQHNSGCFRTFSSRKVIPTSSQITDSLSTNIVSPQKKKKIWTRFSGTHSVRHGQFMVTLGNAVGRRSKRKGERE